MTVQFPPIHAVDVRAFSARILSVLAGGAAVLTFALTLTLSVTPLARAQSTMAPDQLVRTTVDKVIATIKTDQAIQDGDLKRILALAETTAAPHFDFERMARLAMGANWKRANPAQQKDIVEQFRSLLLRTYAVALREYRDQTIDVRPVKLAAGQEEAQVRTLINQPGAKAIPIDYEMQRTADGWKVYDVTIAGVSLVINFRSAFDSEIRKSGVDGLIKSLVERNASASAGVIKR